MSNINDIPPLAHRTRLQQTRNGTKKEKPLLVRFLLWILCAIVFFGIGYGIFFLQKFQTFISANTGQQVTVTHPKTAALPNITEPTNQTNILLLGSDNDQKFSGSNPLTQTMMVVHI